MLEVQRKGGPDLSNFTTFNNVTLGHNLLSVIGYQPQPYEKDGLLMTFNGTWFNYKEHYPYSTSDTVSLLDHFFRKGLDALEDVNGMFSIGLYDRINQKLHLIVDRFGQKQLYYYHDKEKFAFASNPAALFHLLPKKEINQEALQTYWLLGSVMGENSLIKGIKKVCGGEIVTFDIQSENVERNRYYEPKYVDNAISIIEDVVIDAIDKVKVADVPIHIFLSGGIDSTLVASRFQGGDAIHLDSTEYEYANRAACMFDIKLKVIKPEEIEVEENLMDYCTFSGEPGMAALIPYITAKEVSRYGRVAITANGADELFFGYDRMSNGKQNDGIFRMSAFPDYIPYIRYKESGLGLRQFTELYSYVQYDLNKTLDFASMAHGVEMRSPFLDHRLVEAALSIPESVHRKKGNKTILKEMLRKMAFSEEFLNRPKVGFSLHRKPKDLNLHIAEAWKFVRQNKLLNMNENKLTGRDRSYLEMSALSLYYFLKVNNIYDA
jgi:asparagine synthase (glutamine-hydrolysing)